MNLIFDVDGTLWNTTGIVAGAWQRAADTSGLTSAKLDAGTLKKEFGKTMDVIAQNVFPDIKDKEGRDKVSDLCMIFEQEDLDAMDEKTTESILYEGIRETLKDLRERNRLFIVSNCQAGYIELFIKKTRTEDLIEDHLCYGDTGLEKNGTINMLMERHNLKKEDTFYIGDTEGDQNSSRLAGIEFVFASYGFGTAKDPKQTIETFSDLRKIF